MNYYIQGDAANADKIKAAFKEKGYDVSGLDTRNEDILFFTYKLDGGGNVISTTNANLYTAHIIKTHPDYKELELPVEPKFKVGDWIINQHGFLMQITKVTDNFYHYNYDGESYICDIEQTHRSCHLLSIDDAKDGDVLVTTNIRSCPFIYRKNSYNNRLAYYYAGIDGNGNFCEGCIERTLFHFGSVENVVPATKEQRDRLFAEMKEAGYEWDADKKEFRKIIKPKFKVGDEIVWNEPKGSAPAEPVKIIQLVDKDQLYMVDMPKKVGYVPYDMQDYYKLVQPKPHYDISNFKPFDHCRFKPTETHDWIYADFWYVQAHYKVERLSAIEKWES